MLDRKETICTFGTDWTKSWKMSKGYPRERVGESHSKKGTTYIKTEVWRGHGPFCTFYNYCNLAGHVWVCGMLDIQRCWFKSLWVVLERQSEVRTVSIIFWRRPDVSEMWIVQNLTTFVEDFMQLCGEELRPIYTRIQEPGCGHTGYVT
jgi:hypothetical protein